MLSSFRLMVLEPGSKSATYFKRLFQFSLIACGLIAAPKFAEAQAFVPGTGTRLTQVGDDFEDPAWGYVPNNPKSSYEQDKEQRLPSGHSTNGRWGEGLMRGQPDVVKRVPTPPDGIVGSEGAMLLVSKFTGIPDQPSGSTKQDDFICIVDSRIGGPISVARQPSVVTHVYLPPFDKWERRQGNSFCFRAACQAWTTEKKKSGWFGGFSSSPKLDTYWPGILIWFNPGDGDKRPDSASLVVRAAGNGGDYQKVPIKEPGWWTLGMSFTPDGQVHYYAHAGVEPLTEKDHIASEFPYGMKAEQMSTFFFDVLNQDNGTWSTPWIVDDSFAYTK
jgi:hypothetical protein